MSGAKKMGSPRRDSWIAYEQPKEKRGVWPGEKPYRQKPEPRPLDDSNPVWVLFCIGLLLAVVWFGLR